MIQLVPVAFPDDMMIMRFLPNILFADEHDFILKD